MIARLFRQLGWMLALNLISKPLWILAENAAQDRLGHEAFGQFAALFALAYIFSPVVDLGANQLLTRDVAAEPAAYRTLMGRVLGLKGLLTAAYLLTVILLGGVWLAAGPQDWALLAVAAGVNVGLSFVLLFRGAFQAHQAFGWDGVASVLDKLAFLAVLGVLFALPSGFSLQGYALAMLAVTALTAAVLGAVAGRRYGLPKPRFQRADLRAAALGGLPFALLFVLSSLNERAGQVLLAPLAGEKASGLYAGAFRWYGAFSMYLWTVLPVFFARFAQLRHRPPDETRPFFEAGLAAVSLPVMWISAFIFWHGERLFFLFTRSTPEEIARMTACLRWLALALAVNGLFNIFSTWLTATGHEKAVNRLLIGAALLTLALNTLLIPALEELAPAIGLAASLSFLSAGYVVMFRRVKDSPPVPWSLLTRLVVAACVSWAALGAAQLAGWPWWAGAAASGALLLALVPAMRLFDWRAFRR